MTCTLNARTAHRVALLLSLVAVLLTAEHCPGKWETTPAAPAVTARP